MALEPNYGSQIMGLTPNTLSVLGLTFERFWGAAAPAARFTPVESTVASSPAAGTPTPYAASVARPVLPGWVARLGEEIWSAAVAFVRAMQASRMRQARRMIAEYRNRLPRPEGSIE
jgi:hypothetical protein